MQCLFSYNEGRRAGIYEIFNLVSRKRYIGSALKISQRARLHRSLLGRGKHHSARLQQAWEKHGPAVFVFRIIEVCDPPQLIAKEQAAFDRLRPEYNAAPNAGNCLGVKLSAEARAKISASRMGNQVWLGRKHSAETLALMSEVHKGNTRTKGKPRSPEAVEKTAAAHRGMKRSLETRAKISAAMRGKKRAPRSKEWREAISAALQGKAKSASSIEKMRATKRGRQLTAEHRAKIGLASKAAWAARKSAG